MRYPFRCEWCGRRYFVRRDLCKCGRWDCVVETRSEKRRKGRKKEEVASPKPEQPKGPQKASEWRAEIIEKIPTGFSNWDEVLDGGVVPSSVVLVAGMPGTGKSTTLTKMATTLAAARGGRALYLSSEMLEAELVQIARRAKADLDKLDVWYVTDIVTALEAVIARKPAVVVYDSIQQFGAAEKQAGIDATVKIVLAQLCQVGKRLGLVSLAISQVNGENLVAGPRQLEHLVDCIVYLEPDKLFVEKNRSGRAPKEVSRVKVGADLWI